MSISAQLAEYLAGAADAALPPDVEEKTALHVLDTLAAGISGSRLTAGIRGQAYAARHPTAGGVPIWGTALKVDAGVAALANGMAAHADETDDSHAPSISHPGCGVVPAALALGPELTREHLFRAVAAGYDVGTRLNLATGTAAFRDQGARSSHAFASLFGAVAAGAVALRLPAERAMAALSYGTQLASGVTTWLRDRAHVEKAFVFAGMPAHNGVLACRIADAGWESVPDPFDSAPSFFGAHAENPHPGLLVDGLGTRFEVMATTIKKYAVGSPAQAAVQAAEDLVQQGIVAADVTAIEILLPANAAHVVDGRDMPDVCVQYLVAGTLVDRGFGFAMAHDHARMEDPEIRALWRHTRLVPDEATSGTRAGTVRVRMRDDRVVTAVVTDVRGTAENPMTRTEIVAKSEDLLEPVLGRNRTRELITQVLDGDPSARLAALG
ncbi:MmgE/PrpD family protein [Pseudonocardia ailaonensis]|uniref:MmgE/PrpD family protein n=1 Tax=Pseudonocardia ailaonensis TaxID=367279 RepID=A0ABN2NPU6_9PSEU